MSENLPKIGFIGVGAMGAPMAKNVMKAGYPVVAYDIRTEALEDLKRAGAEVASSPPRLARSCTVIITMLPSPKVVRDVVFGKDGVLAEIGGNHLLVEMSTIDLDLTLEIARAVEGRGGMFLDCPVGGTPDKVETRDVEILVSGNKKESYEKFVKLFDALGKRVVYVGKAGNGKIVKLSVNAMIAVHKLAAIEATSVALKNGVDPEVLIDVISHSTANSVVFERYGRTMLGEQTPFTKRHTWHLKDLQLMGELCRTSGSPLFLGSLAHEIIQSACNEDGGVESIGASVKFYRKAGGMSQ